MDSSIHGEVYRVTFGRHVFPGEPANPLTFGALYVRQYHRDGTEVSRFTLFVGADAKLLDDLIDQARRMREELLAVAAPPAPDDDPGVYELAVGPDALPPVAEDDDYAPEPMPAAPVPV